jgi:tetratricopeptide (TPR) repeat protein
MMNEKTNISIEEFEQIEKYLLDSLSPEETRKLETKIGNDPVFTAKVEEVKILIRGVESASLQDKLDTYHQRMSSSETVKASQGSGSRIPIYAVAALFIALLGIFWFFNAESDSEKLFAKHFTPDPGLPTQMGTTNDYQFYDGMVSYKRNDFETALSKWNPILEQHPKNDTLQYFIGVAYLAAGEDHNALNRLKELYESKPESFKNETAFYLGMAYLKLDDLENAIKYLTFSETDRAQKVLLEIDN